MTGMSSDWISSISSFGNKLAISPELRMLFKLSRNVSSLISLSVNMKVMPLPSNPATRYKYFMSSIKLPMLYVLNDNKMNLIVI